PLAAVRAVERVALRREALDRVRRAPAAGGELDGEPVVRLDRVALLERGRVGLERVAGLLRARRVRREEEARPLPSRAGRGRGALRGERAAVGRAREVGLLGLRVRASEEGEHAAVALEPP